VVYDVDTVTDEDLRIVAKVLKDVRADPGYITVAGVRVPFNRELEIAKGPLDHCSEYLIDQQGIV